MDIDNSVKHSFIVKEILSVKVKDPTIFESKGNEYTNYKIQTKLKDYQDKIQKIQVYHRYTDFSNFKNEIEMNLNRKVELVNQFPTKPSKLFAYGQFTSNHVEERSKKFNDWLNELLTKSKKEYKEIEQNIIKFLLEGESEDKTSISLEIKLSDPLHFKKDPESTIEFNKLPLLELKDSDYWYNLKTYKILVVEALNKSHFMNYLSSQSYRIVFKTLEGKSFALASSTNKNDILTFFSRLIKLLFTTLNLSKEESIFFLPDIIDFIQKKWEEIKKEGYNFLEFKKKINQVKSLLMFDFPRQFALTNIENLHPGLICPHCKKVATKPIMNVISIDDSIYCKNCLLPKLYKDLVDHHLSSEDEQLSVDSFFSKIIIEYKSCPQEKLTTINNLSVYCPFKKFGCKIIVKNEDISKHINFCSHRNFSCPNTHSCSFTSNNSSLMLEHLRICNKGFFTTN